MAAKQVKIVALKNQAVIADRCRVASSFLSRLIGLIGTQSLAHGQGLLIRPCKEIHMWFMSIPIDVVFIRKEINSESTRIFRVTSIKENYRPWSLFPVGDRKASETIELPVGTIKKANIQEGDTLCIS